MQQDKHSPFRENIPAYALGALDGDEIAALELHLKTCASCRTELAEYRLVSDSLLTAIPSKQPSAALRKQLQSRLPSARKVSRPTITWSFSRLALGFAVVALLALNFASFAQIQQVHNQQMELASRLENSQAALAMLSYSETERLSIQAEDLAGSFLLDKERNVAALIVWNMPQLKENQTYQIWLIDPQGDRTSAGIFNPTGDQAYTTQVIHAQQGFSNFTGIGVTIEPEGGSQQPTGERVLKVDF